MAESRALLRGRRTGDAAHPPEPRPRPPGRQAGGAPDAVPLEEADAAAADLFDEARATELLALDQALDRLAEFGPEGADVLVYRFFGGLSHEEVAEVVGASEATVRRRWRAAKTWLRSQLEPEALDRTVDLLGGRAG